MTGISLKTRLAALHVIAVALVLAATAIGADQLLSRVVLGEVIDDALVALAEGEAAELTAAPQLPIHVHELAPGAARLFVDRLDKFVQVVELDGTVVARGLTLGTTQIPTSRATLDRLRRGEVVFETIDHFARYPLRAVSLPVELGGRPYAVQVAMSLHDAHAMLRAARRLFVGMAVTILAGVGLSGAWLAHRALAPIDRVVHRARYIGESTLGERLPHPGRQDEVGRLVDALNAMLARIEHGVEIQRRFAADASHELRSPLARLRAELEITLLRPREPAAYAVALRSCLDEVEWLSRLTDQLLSLARLDVESRRTAGPGSAPLQTVLDDAVRRIAPKAEQRGVEILLDPRSVPAVAIRVAPGVAGLLFVNLLDNAVKFSPNGGRVHVALTTGNGIAAVTVADAGPGITAEDLPRLFQPFYRGQAEHSAQTPGVGLGLAICRMLVQRHGGRITAESPAAGGAIFRVELPLAGPDDDGDLRWSGGQGAGEEAGAAQGGASDGTEVLVEHGGRITLHGGGDPRGEAGRPRGRLEAT
jgi:two-component system OmpR family sensor kinase